MSAPTGDHGPAVRAVLADYHQRLAAYRRRRVIGRVLTVALVLWALAGALVAPAIALANGAAPFWLGTGLPVGALVLWLLVRDRLADGLGTRGEPAFPTGLVEIAAGQDAATAAPRSFGSVPEAIRVYHPEHW